MKISLRNEGKINKFLEKGELRRHIAVFFRLKGNSTGGKLGSSRTNEKH